MPRTHFPLKISITAVALCMVLSACGNGDDGSQANANPSDAPEVTVLEVQPAPRQIDATLPGRIAAVRTAEVRARVSGLIEKRNFEEGSEVEAGQVLYTLDPAPMAAALARAKAALQRTEAEVHQATTLVRRYEPLAKARAVSQQEYDNAVSALKSAQADRAAAKAEVQTAELNLGYTTVKAPISGRIGRSLVSEGSLIGSAETTALARIQQLDPIYADFQQSVTDLIRLRAAHASGALGKGTAGDPDVSIELENTDFKQDGRLLFSEVSVDPTSGQVVLRGEFPNPQRVLLPGMYVRVLAATGVDPKSIFVPQKAIQRGSDGIPKVMLVDGDNTVRERVVRTGVMEGANWQITQGLDAGDRVIVERAEKLAAGTKVRVRPDAKAAQSETGEPAAS